MFPRYTLATIAIGHRSPSWSLEVGMARVQRVGDGRNSDRAEEMQQDERKGEIAAGCQVGEEKGGIRRGQADRGCLLKHEMCLSYHSFFPPGLSLSSIKKSVASRAVPAAAAAAAAVQCAVQCPPHLIAAGGDGDGEDDDEERRGECITRRKDGDLR